MSDQIKTEKPELARRQGNVFVGTLGIFGNLARLLLKPFHHHFNRRYHGKYKHARKLFVFDLVLLGMLLVLAGVLIWFFFFRETLADKITLTAEATPTEITSGNPVTFTIFYENRSKITLNNVDLAIRMPAHFEFLQAYPKDYNPRIGRTFLGTLEPGEHGQAKITGLLWADVGRPTIIFSSLDFTSAKDGRRGVKFNRTEFPIARSVLELSAEAPDRMVGGQNVNFTLKYRNTGDRPLSSVQFAPSWPEGFAYVSSEPRATDGRFSVGNLEPNTEGTVTITGRAPSFGDKATFAFDSFLEIDGDELNQGTLSFERPLIPQPLSLMASLEGIVENSVKPDALLTIKIAYQNKGKVTLNNVAIGAAILSAFAEREELLVDSKTEPALESIEPDESGTITVNVRLRDSISTTSLEAAKNFLLTIRPIGRYILPDGVSIPVEASGPEIVRRVESQLILSAFARYWTPEGDQLGRGPIPPVAGETTKYWIFWNLTPITNDLEHLQINANLPADVEFTGRASVTTGSPIVFLPESRTVSWTIDQLPATLGTGQVLSARFEVAITPTFDQIGETPVLVEATTVRARDLFTETDISTTTVPLTTSLPLDKRAAGKGVVQAP